MLNKFSMDSLANSLNQLPLISASSFVFIPDALDYHDQNRKDGLFFDAGTVILVLSESVQSACIAAAHMETMLYAQGLGMLYSGFFTRTVASVQS
ncbi:hypothetical protein [Clostridium estertheticum]|uniref:hypothetical protein n=1 Tax=Clostridium estertheticum TaxID=238834 RepID=UPI001CF4DAB2|nr:hypothetical protein [Clostridium estertheticum]MCB2359113.1 hypothetical protein [Clostridium estertheticum]